MSLLSRVSQIQAHEGPVWQATWHSNGHLLASCSSHADLRVWNWNGHEMTLVQTLSSPEQGRSIRSVAFCPRFPDLLASCGFDGKSILWERNKTEESWKQVAVLQGHENEVKCVAWQPVSSNNYVVEPQQSTHVSTLLATCGRDRSIWIWEVSEDFSTDCIAVLQEHSQDVKHIQWHPTGQLLASASADDTIRLWHEDEEEDEWLSFALLKGHTNIVWSLDFDHTGRFLASTSQDGCIRLWDGKHFWNCVFCYENACPRPIYSIAWSPFRPFLAIGGGDNSISIFRLDEGLSSLTLVLKKELAHAEDVNDVVWNPKDPLLLVSCSDDGYMKFWNYSTDN